eukprot:4931902-Pleurochrysis_carterae.AAC.1
MPHTRQIRSVTLYVDTPHLVLLVCNRRYQYAVSHNCRTTLRVLAFRHFATVARCNLRSTSSRFTSRAGARSSRGM